MLSSVTVGIVGKLNKRIIQLFQNRKKMLAWGQLWTQYCMHAECTQIHIHTQARTLEFMMHVLFQAPGKGTLSKNNK